MTPATTQPVDWIAAAEAAMTRYDDALLRQVAGKLLKPRSQWPVEELRARCVAALGNPATLDRRLKDLAPTCLQALALLAHSRQPLWPMGHLLELLLALGDESPLMAVFQLMETGLLFPVLPEGFGPLRSFEQWVGFPAPGGLFLFAPPSVAERVLGTDLGLPDLSRDDDPDLPASPAPAALATTQTADGLDWLLRLAVLWQQVLAAPLRRTQQGAYFKRDQERLTQDDRLTGVGGDQPAELPDAGFLLAELAERLGLLRQAEGDLQAGDLPAAWEDGLPDALADVWAAFLRVRQWNPVDGWRVDDATPAGTSYASAILLAVLLLARLDPAAWIAPARVQAWIQKRHPFWKGDSVRPSRLKPWLADWLLAFAYPLRLVHLHKDDAGGWLVRATPLARWLVGQGGRPDAEPAFPQTLLVQPNLEILAYRQGLTPALVARLSQFATWKALSPACTLQLEPETVYRALEAGESFETIKATLERHGTRALPPAVVDLLRTWSNKRDRITVLPAGVLLEFASAADLEDAFTRGLQAIRLAPALALVGSEDEIDFKHFKLTGSRDYTMPSEKCVTVEADGVTLAVDATRSDLILETELPRFADALPSPAGADRRLYRLTPASLRRGRDAGLTPATLEAWFTQRTGQPLSAAARLLLQGPELATPTVRRCLVLHVAEPEIADGLVQWPETRGLIAARLGPTALAVEEGQLPRLRETLAALGITLTD